MKCNERHCDPFKSILHSRIRLHLLPSTRKSATVQPFVKCQRFFSSSLQIITDFCQDKTKENNQQLPAKPGSCPKKRAAPAACRAAGLCCRAAGLCCRGACVLSVPVKKGVFLIIPESIIHVLRIHTHVSYALGWPGVAPVWPASGPRLSRPVPRPSVSPA